MALAIAILIIVIDALFFAYTCAQIHPDTAVYGLCCGPIGILVSCGFCLRDMLAEMKRKRVEQPAVVEAKPVMTKRIKLKPMKF